MDKRYAVGVMHGATSLKVGGVVGKVPRKDMYI